MPTDEELLAHEIEDHQFTEPLRPQPEPPHAERVAAQASGRVWFRGLGWTCTCVANSLPAVEDELLIRGLISNSVDIYQLGYRNDVSASAGTHAGGGNTDVAQYNDAQIDVWRLHGWTIQHRTRAQGFSIDHGHGWPLGCPHLSPSGNGQWSQWRNHTNGLASYGSIAGRWPIDSYTTAQGKRRGIIVAFKDEIINGVVAHLKPELDAIRADAHAARNQSSDIGRQVLAKDGIIAWTDPHNPKVSTGGALSMMLWRVDAILKKVSGLHVTEQLAAENDPKPEKK